MSFSTAIAECGKETTPQDFFTSKLAHTDLLYTPVSNANCSDTGFTGKQERETQVQMPSTAKVRNFKQTLKHLSV